MIKHYPKCLLVAALLLTGGGVGAYAQTDETSTYIVNPGFESSTGETGNIAGGDKANSKDYTGSGWKNTASASWSCSAVIAYGKGQINGAATPATDNAGNAGNALGVSVGWNGSCIYQSANSVTLPAGKYTLTAHVYNAADKETFTSKLGFVPTNGTATISSTTSFKSGVWSTDVVTFTLTTATDGVFQVGGTATNAGSGSHAKVLIDNLTLTQEDLPADVASITDGDYYLYDATNKLFFSRGANWGTEASVDKYGIPITWNSTSSHITFMDFTSKKGASSIGLHLDGTALYTDDGNISTFHFVKASDNGYYLQDENLGSYARYDVGDGGYYVHMTNDKSQAVVWTLLTKAERDAIVNAYPTDNKSAVAKAAGITGDFDTVTKDYVSQVVKTIVPTDYTYTASLNGKGGASTGNPREVYQGQGTFSFTVTGLDKGLYKVTLPALERDGWKEKCVTLNGKGYNITTSYLQAGDQQVRIKAWAEDRVADNNPDNVSQAGSAFTNGKYLNEVYAYVAEDNGTLDLKVVVPSYVDGHWFIMGDTKIYSLKDAVSEDQSNALISTAENLSSQKMSVTAKTTLDAAKTALSSDKTNKTKYQTLSDAITAAQTSVDAYANAKKAIDERKALVEVTNFYTADAYAEYITTPETAYENGTLADNDAKNLEVPSNVVNPTNQWAGKYSKTAVQLNKFFGAAWGTTSYNDALNVNTWSVEGNTDGSSFKVPFYEYWVNDANTLGDKTLTGTVGSLNADTWYKVTADVRVRVSNKQNTAPVTGITMQVGDGESIAITGKQIGSSQFYLDNYTAYGKTDAKGNLTLKFNVASTNANWLSFQHVKYEPFTPATVTIDEDKYLTYVTETPVDFTKTEGLTAYKAAYANKTITLTKIEKAPAGEAIVLFGNANTYTLSPIGAADAVNGNELKASDGTITGSEDNTIWCLTTRNHVTGFAPVAATVTIPKGKAYLVLSKEEAEGAKFIGINDGTVTGINAFKADDATDNAPRYNLSGQRVDKNYKGIVIINGKKFIKK